MYIIPQPFGVYLRYFSRFWADVNTQLNPPPVVPYGKNKLQTTNYTEPMSKYIEK